MEKIAIFYGPLGGNTEKVALKIAQTFGEKNSILLQVKDATEMDIEPYQNIIFGGPTVGTHTWRDEKGQTDWDQFLVRLSAVLTGGHYAKGPIRPFIEILNSPLRFAQCAYFCTNNHYEVGASKKGIHLSVPFISTNTKPCIEFPVVNVVILFAVSAALVP